MFFKVIAFLIFSVCVFAIPTSNALSRDQFFALKLNLEKIGYDLGSQISATTPMAAFTEPFFTSFNEDDAVFVKGTKAALEHLFKCDESIDLNEALKELLLSLNVSTKQAQTTSKSAATKYQASFPFTLLPFLLPHQRSFLSFSLMKSLHAGVEGTPFSTRVENYSLQDVEHNWHLLGIEIWRNVFSRHSILFADDKPVVLATLKRHLFPVLGDITQAFKALLRDLGADLTNAQVRQVAFAVTILSVNAYSDFMSFSQIDRMANAVYNGIKGKK